MRPCIFTDEISLDFDEAVRTCVQADLVDIQVRAVGTSNVVALDDHEIARLVSIVRTYGMRVVGIGSPFGKCHVAEDEYQRHLPVLDRSIHVAHAFDAPMVRVFAFHRPATESPDTEAWTPLIAERMRMWAERARREELQLVLENEYTTLIGTACQARRAVDAVGSPSLRLCWDVASGWYDGEPILPDGYAQARGAVSDVHIRDARQPRSHGELARPGDGAIPFAEIVRLLARDGYEGTLTLEPHLFPEDPDRWPKRKVAALYGLARVRDWIRAAEERTG